MRFILFTLLFWLASSAVDAQKVYITPSGQKYHRGDCRMVNNVSRKVSIEEAVKAGKQPCKICDPPPANPIPLSSTNKPRGSEITTYQCRGITKKGTRCKHKTRIANGYCFQHNPDKTGTR